MTSLDRNLLRPAVVGLMVAIVMFAVAVLLQLIDPSWNGAYVPLVAVIITVEGYFSNRVLRPQGFYIGHVFRLHLSEAVFGFLLLQIAAKLVDGRWFVGEPPDSGSPFFALVVGSLLVLGWLAGAETDGDLELLGRPPSERIGEDPEGRLVKRFAFGGAILLISGGLAKIGFLALLHPASDIGLLVMLLLLYFVLGVVLLANVHYGTLRIVWQSSGRSIASTMGQTWFRLSAAFLGIAAVIAFMLPTDYTAGILDVLYYVIGVIIAIGTYLLAGVIFLFAWLLSPIARLMTGDGSTPLPPPVPPTPPVMPPAPDGGNGDWVDLLRSLAFWALVLVLAVWIFRSYVWRNKRLAALIARIAPLAWLFNGVRALWLRLTRAGRKAAQRLGGLRRDSARRPQTAAQRRRRDASTLRGELRAQYLKLLDRAADQGVPRRPPETPYEYRATLGPHVSAAEPDLNSLTQAFVEASYSPRDPDRAAVAAAHEQAERIESALAAERAAQEAAGLSPEQQPRRKS